MSSGEVGCVGVTENGVKALLRAMRRVLLRMFVSWNN